MIERGDFCFDKSHLPEMPQNFCDLLLPESTALILRKDAIVPDDPVCRPLSWIIRGESDKFTAVPAEEGAVSDR